MSHPLVKVKRANILICFKQSSVARKQNKKRAVVKDTRVVHLTVTPFCFISTRLPIPLSRHTWLLHEGIYSLRLPIYPFSEFLYHFGITSRSGALMMAIAFQNIVARALLPLFGHLWVVFVVCLLCSEKYFSRPSGFPLLSKTNRTFHFI